MTSFNLTDIQAAVETRFADFVVNAPDPSSDTGTTEVKFRHLLCTTSEQRKAFLEASKIRQYVTTDEAGNLTPESRDGLEAQTDAARESLRVMAHSSEGFELVIAYCGDSFPMWKMLSDKYGKATEMGEA